MRYWYLGFIFALLVVTLVILYTAQQQNIQLIPSFTPAVISGTIYISTPDCGLQPCTDCTLKFYQQTKKVAETYTGGAIVKTGACPEFSEDAGKFTISMGNGDYEVRISSARKGVVGRTIFMPIAVGYPLNITLQG
jgi:hypothetical protein